MNTTQTQTETRATPGPMGVSKEQIAGLISRIDNPNRTLGPCVFNGNEIVEVASPNHGVAGIAPDVPESWGHVFAAAPELLAALKELAKYWECGTSVSAGSLVALDALAAIARAESRT